MNEILHKILCKFFSDGIYVIIQFDNEYYLVTQTDINEVDYTYFNKFAVNLKLSMYFCKDNGQGILDTLDYRFKIKSMFPEFII